MADENPTPKPRQAAAAAAADPDERIVITHPDTKGEGVCTRRQFDGLWSKKGWTEVDVKPDELEARVDAVATGIGGTESTVDATVQGA